MPAAKDSHEQAAPVLITVQLPITLGQFLKAAHLVASGGEAKILIADGLVTVNGLTEERRGHELSAGDMVQVRGATAQVAVAPAAAGAPHSPGPPASEKGSPPRRKPR